MYILSATTIRNPHEITEQSTTQVAQQRTLSGRIGRDYFGSTNRVWNLVYKNVLKADYDTIKTIYDAYLATANAVSWEITETNYTVSSTTVHVDLIERQFRVKGDLYLSDFNLILTEA